MPPRYAIALHIERAFERAFRRRQLASLARRALAAEGVASGAELSIVVTDDETVRDLNRRFLGQDRPTDVLSFGMEGDSEFVASADAERDLGEVIISLPTARRQADEAGHDINDELAHLLIHGILHLLGYDHERPGEARRMRAREDELLERPAH